MTLRDDIARYGNESPNVYLFAHTRIVQLIAAGLERDKIIIDRADLPEAKYTGAGYKHSLGRCHEEWGSSNARRHGLEWLAIADAMESRESEAAALKARRDAVARELGKSGYKELYGGDAALRMAIDRIIQLAEKLESK